ncbi:unnamed protein product [Urochloa humidicola]
MVPAATAPCTLHRTPRQNQREATRRGTSSCLAASVGVTCLLRRRLSLRHSPRVLDSEDDDDNKPGGQGRRGAQPVVREGVEFYNSVDYYKGEFHEVRCKSFEREGGASGGAQPPSTGKSLGAAVQP